MSFRETGESRSEQSASWVLQAHLELPGLGFERLLDLGDLL